MSGEERVEQASVLMERLALAHGLDDSADMLSSDDASTDDAVGAADV